MNERSLERRLRSRSRFLKPRSPSTESLRHARIPAEFHEARLTAIPDKFDYKNDLFNYAENAEVLGRGGGSLILHGPHGHGKTASACALLRVFLVHDVPALFVRWSEIGRIFKSWDEDSRELQERIMWIRAIVIDDVGERIAQDFDQTISAFVQVIRHRHDEKLVTFLTLNKDPESFFKEFESQSSLFSSMRFPLIEVRGKNWRGEAR